MPECGARIGDELKLCPKCGTLIELAKTQPIERAWPPGQDLTGRADRRRVCLRHVGHGRRLRRGRLLPGTTRPGRAHARDAQLHFSRGQQNLSAKKYDLAIAEFEYVLQIAPDFPRAPEMLAERAAAW